MKKKISMTRKLEFDAGHRLVKHEGKCAHVHGHRYTVEVTCEPIDGQLDHVGRVVDFGVVKKFLGYWLDENIDHGFIAFRDDPLLPTLKEHNQKLYIVPFEPTAENLAGLILERGNEILKEHGVVVTHIRLFETPNCWADASLES